MSSLLVSYLLIGMVSVVISLKQNKALPRPIKQRDGSPAGLKAY